MKNCILLNGQNLNLHFADQQLHPRPRTFFKLVGWLSPKTHLKSGLIPENPRSGTETVRKWGSARVRSSDIWNLDSC